MRGLKITFRVMNIRVPKADFAQTRQRQFFYLKITTAIDSSTPLYYLKVLSVFNLDFKILSKTKKIPDPAPAGPVILTETVS